MGKMDGRGNPADQLDALVDNMEKTLKAEGINNNRYMIIGYGGDDIHAPAHQHTINGRIFNTAQRFAKGAKALSFQGKYATDAFEALKMASEAKYRPQASRIVMLITEDERSAVNTSLKIEEVQSLLEDNSIILNVISEFDDLYKSRKYIGLLHDLTLLTNKDKTKARLPSRVGQMYAKLSSATKGSLYRLDMMQDQHINFLDKVPENIAKQVRSAVATYKTCQCVRDDEGRAISKCENIRS